MKYFVVIALAIALLTQSANAARRLPPAPGVTTVYGVGAGPIDGKWENPAGQMVDFRVLAPADVEVLAVKVCLSSADGERYWRGDAEALAYQGYQWGMADTSGQLFVAKLEMLGVNCLNITVQVMVLVKVDGRETWQDAGDVELTLGDFS